MPLQTSSNPLRKQTLLGIAPAASAATATSAQDAKVDEPGNPIAAGAALPLTPTAALEAPPAPAPVSSITAPPDAVESDAPTTVHVAESSRLPALEPTAGTFADDDAVQLRARRPRWLPVGFAAAALLALGVVALRRLDHAAAPPALPAAAPVDQPARPAPVVEQLAPSPVAAPAASAHPTDNDSALHQPPTAGVAKPTPSAAEPSPSSAEPTAQAAEPSPSSAEPTAQAAPSGEAESGEVRRIFIKSDPPGARMFWRGKEVGTTPFTLELKPGEKHAYELGLPGHVTRKVVIDGSKSEISIGMRPEPGVFTGASPRK